MTAELPPSRFRFPDPETGLGAEGVLCIGGDFAPSTLLHAYRRGIFPWPAPEAGVVPWCSPDPRAVLPLSPPPRFGRSVRRALRRPLRITVDRAFADVLAGCADRGNGTWITPAYVTGFARLHSFGFAHSLEVWNGDALVGGVYGLSLGTVFSAESMFHRETDASKVAIAHLAARLAAAGFDLLDGEVPSPHLSSLGFVDMPRAEFLSRLARGLSATPAPRLEETPPP